MGDHEDDDVILLLRAGIRSEIGDDADGLDIRYANEETGAVFVAGAAPPPFDGHLMLARFDPAIDVHETGAVVGRVIADLRGNHEDSSQRLRRGAEIVAARAVAACGPWEAVGYGPVDGPVETLAVMTLDILDDALRPTSIRIVFNETGPVEGLAVMRSLRGQRTRRDAGGITVDPVLAAVMGDDLEPLLNHLRRTPKDDATPAWDTGTWTNGRLARLGVDVPACVETVRIRDGHVYGRVRLAPRTTWTNGNLVHRSDALPQSTINTLVGRPLGDVVQAPHIPADSVIETASMNLGSLRIGASANPIRISEQAT